jgi:hypothetical protein
MELALPLIALGSMYIISNQGRNQQRQEERRMETYANMGASEVNSAALPTLPNTDIPPQNYPSTNLIDLLDTVQEYPNPNAATDKYFDQNVFENRTNKGQNVGQNPQEIFSLTGNYLNTEQFKHNNMVPFVGGKKKGYTYNMAQTESILDNMAGAGSNVIKKVEQAPLFKPETDMSWAFGAPNQSDFYQSRVNPGMISNNVKPFATENVGPGLNQGYTTQGSNGYNSGMEARDAWLPRTVDQLRVDTNPKLEYTLDNLEGPSYSHVQNVGIIGRVEKQKPDTFFVNSQERWLTTVGDTKAQALRPEQELGVIRREDVANNYTGPAGLAGERQAGYAPTTFEPSKRAGADSTILDVPLSNASGRGPITDGERYIKSYISYGNNRSTSKQPDTMRNSFNAIVGAAIAPLLDVFRTTKKQTTLASAYNPASSKEGHVIYDAAYMQTNNDLKSSTIDNRPNQGGTQMFNQYMNVSTLRQDTDRMNNRLFTPSSVTPLPPSVQLIGRQHGGQSYDYNKTGIDRIQPDLLNAFKANPYTHCLTDAV